MRVLQEIYETLKDLGYCKDQEDFSSRWLGRSPGYFAYLKSSKAPPCLVSLKALVALLFSVIPSVDESSRYVERRRLRAAWVSAGVMFDGEREIAFAKQEDWITAVGPIPALNWQEHVARPDEEDSAKG